LYNDERELLSIRLRLLAPVVDRFVIVWSRETFTGLKKTADFPNDLLHWPGLEGKVELITLDTLQGRTAWEKESFSRNAVARGLNGVDPSDLVMISDVDELARPEVLTRLAATNDLRGPVVLAQDYYNFKFNYRLVHGMNVVWAGPILCPHRDFESAQGLRKSRWHLLDQSETRVDDAGWHFSFLTRTESVGAKLASFSHQEDAVQSRGRAPIDHLIERREGFLDHLHAGSVWAVVGLEDLRCAELELLVGEFRGLSLPWPADDASQIALQIRHVTRRICYQEREKVMALCGWRELMAELGARLRRRTLPAARRG
jgi:beta-1,4-mannosyl-glycoprotein beta-1,4-N-acetylglucosaminyltransferase